MTAVQISAHFPPSAFKICADATYAVPKLSWLKDRFWPWFQARRWELGLRDWTRKNDCDNFARAYAQAAADCHALTPAGASEGLAVGEFYYTRDAGGNHAINAAFTDHGLTFIEPQTGGVLKLSPSELSSCFFVRF